MLGSNVPTVGGLAKAFLYAEEWGCECIQVYITPSRKWEVPELTKEFVKGFKNAWVKTNVKSVVAHVPFLVNLASLDQRIREKSIERLKNEIAIANTLDINYLVLHPGSYRRINRREGLKILANSLNESITNHTKSGLNILLETMAGQGAMLGSAFEELAYVLADLDNREMFGICFDTAHVFIAGYDIRGYEGYYNVMTLFNDILGTEQLKLFHINDSNTKFNSHNDRHANIGEGELGLQTFHALMTDKTFVDIPKILEIPDRDNKSKDNMLFLRELQTLPAPIYERQPEGIQSLLGMF